VSARVWKAPAREWFSLLERVAGEPVEHGNAPIRGGFDHVRLGDLARATAFASRIPWEEKSLRDLPSVVVLPSGRKITVEVQAVLTVHTTPEQNFALVNDRVLAQWDELAPGVTIDDVINVTSAPFHGGIDLIDWQAPNDAEPHVVVYPYPLKAVEEQ